MPAPSASVPAVLAGRVTTRTAFRLSPVSSSSNTPSNCAAVNVSAVSSLVLTFRALAVGASFALLTVIVAVAAATDSTSDWSATLNVKLTCPFQFTAGVNFNVPSEPRTIF